MTTQTGRITAVEVVSYGDVLAEDTLAGATTLHVDDAVDFDEDGGYLRINEEVIAYTAADLELDVITLGAPLTADAVEGDAVEVWDMEAGAVSSDVVAQVAVEGTDFADDALEAIVDHSLTPLLPIGIRDSLGEAVSLEYRGEDLYVTDILGRAPVIDGSVIDPTTIPSQVPTSPPSSSPELTVTGLPNAIVLRAQDVEPTTEIDYHISTTSGFTPDATTLSISTRATVYVVVALPDGSALDADATYYVRAVARNVAGSAAASSEQQAKLDLAAVSDYVAANVIAGFVLTGLLQVGNITIDPNTGITIPQSSGGTTHLSADGTGNSFAGEGTFGALTVLGNLSIRGTSNFMNGLITLAKGVTDPGQVPIISTDYAKTALAGRNVWRGLTLSGTSWVATSGAPGYPSFVSFWDRTTGANAGGFTLPSPYEALGGAVRLGAYLYVLARDSNSTSTWQIRQYNPVGNSFVQSWTFTISGLVGYPIIGTDGTYVTFAYASSTNALQYRKFDVSTVTFVGGSINFAGWGTSTPTGLQELIVEGASRVVVSTAIGHYAFSLSGTTLTRDTSREWPAATSGITGVWHDGTVWNAVAADAYGDSTVYTYTTNSGQWDFAYTWYDSDSGGAGLAETLPSPTKVITPTKFARWTVTLPAAPPDDGTTDGANTARIYASPHGSALVRQATLAEGILSQAFTSLLTSGSAAPAVSGFATRTSTKGRISSAAADSSGAIIDLVGDGSGRAGPLSWDTSGAVTKAAGLLRPVGRATATTASATFANGSAGNVGTVTVPLVAGRRYRVTWQVTLNPGTAGMFCLGQLRHGVNAAVGGTDIATMYVDLRAAARVHSAHLVGEFTATVTQTENIVAVITGNGGTIATYTPGSPNPSSDLFVEEIA